MTKRRVSDPLLSLLEQAALSCSDVDSTLDRQAARWAHPVIRHSHIHVRRVRTSTRIGVVAISRRYRRLLVDVEHRGPDGVMLWHYRELGRANCLFRCNGVVPRGALAVLLGASLGNLIQPYPALSAATVKAAELARDGWIELTVEPAWHVF